MLRFVDFPEHKTLTGRVPGAFILGQDQVAVAGDISRRDGLIHCEKTTGDAAALALQVRLDEDTLATLGDPTTPSGFTLTPLGTLVLQTCLLPERDEPYPLVLELARHRIMMTLQRLEHWGSFEHAEGTLAMELFEESRRCFVEALVHAPDTMTPGSDAYKTALRALWLAIASSEHLAMLQARHDLPARVDGSLFARFNDEQGTPESVRPLLHPARGGVVMPHKPMIGTLVSPRVFAEPTRDAITKSCDFVTIPMRWREMEPTEGDYDFTRTDRWIEWAIRTAKLPVVAGPLIDFRAISAPDWLYIWENDYETLRELVYEHIKALVTRYRRTVSRWTVCSGFHCGGHFKLSFEQMMDLTRICVLVARKLHPKAKIQVEIAQPWGEYHTRDRASLPPLLYAEMLSQAGVQLDAFSMRLQMGSHRAGLQTRDLMALSELLDRYAMLDRPITISAFGAPAGPDPRGEKTTSDSGPPPEPGAWRRPWSPESQADWLSAVASIAASKPYIESISWHELADPGLSEEMPMGGLMDMDGNPRPALARLGEARAMLESGAIPEHWGPAPIYERSLASPAT